MGIIYVTENLFNKNNGINPWRYIGSDQHNNPTYYGSNRQLKHDINKYGLNNFIKYILEDCGNIDNKELRKIEAEKYLKPNKVKSDMSYYNNSESYSPGCGQKGMKHSKKFERSETWRENRRGHDVSIDTRALMRDRKLGSKASDETKKKMSIRTQGENNPNALLWSIVSPSGEIYTVIGLRKWVRDNGFKFYDIYNSKNGWISTKNGVGKGGRKRK